MGYYKKRGGRRWFRNRYSRRMPTPTAWFPIGNQTFTGLTAAAPEAFDKLMAGQNVDRHYVSTGPTTQLDWSNRGNPLVERILLTIVVTVTNCLVKKAIRYWFGLRVSEGDKNLALPSVANSPSLALADASSRFEDWLYFSEGVVAPAGVAGSYDLVEWRGAHEIFLDFKPRRKLDLTQMLVFQHRWAHVDNTFPDANLTAVCSGRILVKQR